MTCHFSVVICHSDILVMTCLLIVGRRPCRHHRSTHITRRLKTKSCFLPAYFRHRSTTSLTRSELCFIFVFSVEFLQYYCCSDFGICRFYPAMLRRARLCHNKSSVRPSAYPSVRDVQVCLSRRLKYFENKFTAE